MIAQKYKAVPYLDGGRTVRGADCWGLVRLVLMNEYGVKELPEWGHIREAQHSDIDEAYQATKNKFLRVTGLNADVNSGDVVCVFNASGECAHLGIVVPGDTGPTVLHTRPESGFPSSLPLARFAHLYDHRIEYWRYAVN